VVYGWMTVGVWKSNSQVKSPRESFLSFKNFEGRFHSSFSPNAQKSKATIPTLPKLSNSSTFSVQ
jgi:hypothetical protein